MKQLLILFIFLSFWTYSQDSADDLLLRSIRYHDPENVWPLLQATFHYKETRPTGPDRKTVFEVNNRKGEWKLNRDDEEIYEVVGEVSNVLKGEKGPDRGLMLRNYYLYLWGLPMKLKDASTPTITQVEDEVVNGIKVNVLRVAYEKETYYFSFDPSTGQMLEYRFYKDEAVGKGELITLSGEVEYGKLKIPKSRSWYTLPEMKFLGTDVLDRID